MSILERIDERLNENFAKGKDAIYLAGYLDTMANHWLKQLKTAVATKNYAGVVNNIVRSGLNDLNAIKKQMDHISKTGKEK